MHFFFIQYSCWLRYDGAGCLYIIQCLFCQKTRFNDEYNEIDNRFYINVLSNVRPVSIESILFSSGAIDYCCSTHSRYIGNDFHASH